MASLYMRFPGGKAKAFTLSYDDGVDLDIRLIELMKKYRLKGTFNLNSGLYTQEGTVFKPGEFHRRLTKDMVTKVYGESGQEIATHGLTHPFLEQLPVNVAQNEIWEDRRNLEEQFHRFIRGHAYPFGTYSENVKEMLRNNGIVYARTINATHSFDMPTDWLELNPTCHHADADLMELADRFVQLEPKNGPQMFYLWGHTFEFEVNDNWEVIEKFAERISGKEDIWYATNIEICDYAHAYSQLIFSNDMHHVYNPTVIDVCFEYKFVKVAVPSGATVEF